jgi:hypothetical protein
MGCSRGRDCLIYQSRSSTVASTANYWLILYTQLNRAVVTRTKGDLLTFNQVLVVLHLEAFVDTSILSFLDTCLGSSYACFLFLATRVA